MGSKLTGFKNGVVCTAYLLGTKEKKARSVSDNHLRLVKEGLSDDAYFVAGLLATYCTIAITGSYAIVYVGMEIVKPLILP